jgi:hypothetical protein
MADVRPVCVCVQFEVIKAYGDAPREMELSAEHVSMLRSVAQDVLSCVTACPPDVASQFEPLLHALRCALAPPPAAAMTASAPARTSMVSGLDAARWRPTPLASSQWAVPASPPCSRAGSMMHLAAATDPCAGTPAGVPRSPRGRGAGSAGRALW